MTQLIDEDIVRLDIPRISSDRAISSTNRNSPMDKAEIVHCLDGENTLCHVKLGHVFGERVVLDQPIISAHSMLLERGLAETTHIVIKSPPGKNSMTRYKYCAS